MMFNFFLFMLFLFVYNMTELNYLIIICQFIIDLNEENNFILFFNYPYFPNLIYCVMYNFFIFILFLFVYNITELNYLIIICQFIKFD